VVGFRFLLPIKRLAPEPAGHAAIEFPVGQTLAGMVRQGMADFVEENGGKLVVVFRDLYDAAKHANLASRKTERVDFVAIEYVYFPLVAIAFANIHLAHERIDLNSANDPVHDLLYAPYLSGI
jgi:hypothetical protein